LDDLGLYFKADKSSTSTSRELAWEVVGARAFETAQHANVSVWEIGRFPISAAFHRMVVFHVNAIFMHLVAAKEKCKIWVHGY
jgi:hypothetical protein